MSEFIGDRLYRIGKASQRLGVSIPTVRNWIYSGKLTKYWTRTFTCKHCEFTINRQVQAPINIAEKYLNMKVKKPITNKYVASPVPAERQLMKTMLGDLREFKERIVRDASQDDELYHCISIISV